VPKFTLGGVELHFQRLGAGPEVVLLHGLTANLAFWHPAVVTGLSAGYSLTLLDLRGHGRSAASPAGYTTRHAALDVEGLLDHLGVERAAVVGHSWGGAIALHLAALRPHRVGALVLADARVRALQPEAALERWEQWPRIAERLAAHGIHIPDDVLAREFGLLEALAELRLAGRLDGLDVRPFFVPFSTGSRSAAERWLSLVRGTSALDEFVQIAGLTPEAIRTVAAPTLAMFGEVSHCWPTAERLAALLPRCTRVTVPGVGHFHPVVAPHAFAERVAAFLDAVTPAAEPMPGGSRR
jgi:pimeloyl-ACP methyl ester carboxylesterase